MRRLREGSAQISDVLLVALVAVAALWAFVALAGEVMEGDTRAFDARVLLALRRPGAPQTPLGPAWLPEVARDITALGGVTVLMLLALSVIGYLLLVKMRRAALLVTVSTLGGAILNAGLKSLFHRPRPELVPHLAQAYSSSFPSGHAMLAATTYLTLAVLVAEVAAHRWARRYVMGLALGLTLLVGASRVYLGVHYPTDVLAGWTGGLGWALVCWLVARALERRGKVESVEPPEDSLIQGPVPPR